MNTILRTEVFDLWLRKLKDSRGKARIVERIRDAEQNNFGGCVSVGHGLFEMRVHFGPGYRVYFTRAGDVVYVLLCGGTKRGQQRDIGKAQQLAQQVKEEWKHEED